MALYTKNGDGGFASLPGEANRLRKDDARLAAIGELDELAAVVGFCMVEAGRTGEDPISEDLSTIQSELFLVGATLAAGGKNAPALSCSLAAMENRIDAICDELSELKDFILPGGCELSCRLHLARTIARRAERAVVAALNPTDDERCSPPDVLRYLNRLGDLLFALARLANHNIGEAEAAPNKT